MTSGTLQTTQERQAKAGFGHIYNEPDPRAYFGALSALGYVTPAHGQKVFSALLAARRAAGEEGGAVLDICSSYGVNAALLNHDVTLDDLYDRYAGPELRDLGTDELAAADERFYGERRHQRAVPVVGLDVADRALAYGERVGLLDVGACENLEHDEPSASLAQAIAGVGLVTVTGGISYISPRTFTRVLDCCGGEGPPSVATFALRSVDYAPYADALARYGLVTESLPDTTFPQRRFVDDEEQARALEELEAARIDPSGREAEGSYHVELFVSRTPSEAAATPLSELLADPAADDTTLGNPPTDGPATLGSSATLGNPATGGSATGEDQA